MNQPETAAKGELANKAQRSSSVLFTRLAIMMFLQYFVQGAYLPVASVYVERTLGFSVFWVGVFGSALAVGPILAPFIVGQIVDRLCATERVMAFCHFVGGILMILLAYQTEVWPVIIIGTVYSILYVPTMMLTNSVAFQHLKNSDMEFPWVRLCGTLGYIVPAYIVELWWLRGLDGPELDKARAIVFVLSGIAGIIMAFYCLTLPRTAPEQREDRKYAPGAVIALLRRQDFLVLVIVSFLIAMAHQFVVVWYSPFVRAILDTENGGAWEQTISTAGQICELAVLALLGLMIKKLGFKRTMVLGTLAYTVRCLIFSLVFSWDPPFAGKVMLAVVGQAMHGFCFGCFMAVGYMYVDRIAPKDVRGSMQTVYGTFILALGFFVGSMAGVPILKLFSEDVGGAVQRDWTSIWLSCAVLCALCVFLMAVFFPAKTDGSEAQT